jgi:hypothetical protein
MQNIYFFITNWNYLFIIYNVIQTIMFYLVCFKFNINELKYNEKIDCDERTRNTKYIKTT